MPTTTTTNIHENFMIRQIKKKKKKQKNTCQTKTGKLEDRPKIINKKNHVKL